MPRKNFSSSITSCLSMAVSGMAVASKAAALAVALTSLASCTAIRKSEETYFYKIALDIVETERENNPHVQANCHFDYSRPGVIDLKQDALDELHDFPFPVFGIYYPDTGYIVYSMGEAQVLTHEYIHHLTRGVSRECLRELTAALAARVYNANESRKTLEQRYRRLRLTAR